MTPEWCPALLLFEDYGGDWPAYEEALYGAYVADFRERECRWRGVKVTVAWNPPYKNKDSTFWHVTSEGDSNGDRIPDLRRCERIRWIRALVEVDSSAVRTWVQSRKNGKTLVIALPDFSFLVFMRMHPDRLHLVTAYHVESDWRRDKYRREYEASEKR